MISIKRGSELAVDLTCLAEKWAGYQYYIVNFVCALSRSSDVYLTLLYSGNKNNLPPELCQNNRCLALAEPFGSRVLTEQFSLPYQLPDDCKRLLVPAYLGPAFAPVPVDLLVYDLCFLRDYSGLSFKQKIYWWGLYRRAFHQADRIFTCSYYTRDELIKKFPGLSGKLGPPLYPGMRQLFRSPKSTGTDSNIESLAPYFLFVGTISPRKNVVKLIKWYLDNPQINNRYNFVLAGKYGWGDVDPDFFNQPRRGLYWYPDVNDQTLLQLYRLARLLVFPSREEGFGMPLLEAFSRKTPVLASDIPVFHEVAGSAAFYLPLYKPEKWPGIFERALNNERERRIKITRGLRRARKFTWSRSAKKYLNSIATGGM